MKARTLAAKLMENPDFDVRFSHSDPLYKGNTEWGWHIRRFNITDICDIGYSDKIIILDGEEI